MESKALLGANGEAPYRHAHEAVLNSLTSDLSRNSYALAMTEFRTWCNSPRNAATGFDRATVQAWLATLRMRGLGSSAINMRLSAIKSLAREAFFAGMIDANTREGIRAVKGAKACGVRTGNWLSKIDAEQLIAAPDSATIKGLRDRAILALLLGCGLRRGEVAKLDFTHIQQLDGRWVVVDLIGKGGRVRSVPMPAWCKVCLDSWASAAGISRGRIFRAVNKGDRVTGETLTSQAILGCVKKYAPIAASALAPHDLRRTFAKLAHRGGSGVDQIQLSLGHASIVTTERYLGVQQDLIDAPCDHLGLKVKVA
jgi:site-specific recombinase XerD